MPIENKIRRVVIAGSRHRGWVEGVPYIEQTGKPEDGEFLNALLDRLVAQYGENLAILSIGCDLGIGQQVRALCNDRKIHFVEITTKFSFSVPKPFYELIYLCRHAALLDVGEEFHIFVSRSRFSNIEDLVQRLQGSEASYAVYDEDNKLIEDRISRGQGSSEAETQTAQS